MITAEEYANEIHDLAQSCAEEAHEQGRDLYDVIHETVDGHQWVIYTRYNLYVLQHTFNPNAHEDLGDIGHVLSERGLDGLHAYLACVSMIADVSDAASDIFDKLEEEEEEEEEEEPSEA